MKIVLHSNVKWSSSKLRAVVSCILILVPQVVWNMFLVFELRVLVEYETARVQYGGNKIVENQNLVVKCEK